MRGKLERLDRGVVHGWAWDPDDPDEVVEIELRISGETVGTFRAERHRGDLARAGIGDGAHAFAIRVGRWLRPGENTIAAVVASDPDTVIGQIIGVAAEDDVRPAAPLPAPGSRGAFEHPLDASPTAQAAPAITAVEVEAPLRPLPGTVSSRPVELAIDVLVDADRELPRTVLRLLDALAKGGHWDAIVAAGTQALDAGVWVTPTALLQYGRALIQLGLNDAARVVLQRLVELDDDPRNLFYLGVANARLRRWQAASAALEACVRDAPDAVNYRREASRALTELGHRVVGSERAELLAAARAHLEHALAAKDQWDVRRDLSALLLSLGDARGAYEHAIAAIAHAPERGLTHAALARAACRLGRPLEALRAAETALELGPADDAAHFNVRFLRRLAGSRTADEVPHVATLPAPAADRPSPTAQLAAAAPAEWVSIGGDPNELRWLVEAHGVAPGSGVDPGDGRPAVWRRAYLEDLLRLGLAPAGAAPAELERAACAHGALTGPGAAAKPPDRSGAVVLLRDFQNPADRAAAEAWSDAYRADGRAVTLATTRDGAAGGDAPPVVRSRLELLRLIHDCRASAVHVLDPAALPLIGPLAAHGVAVAFVATDDSEAGRHAASAAATAGVATSVPTAAAREAVERAARVRLPVVPPVSPSPAARAAAHAGDSILVVAGDRDGAEIAIALAARRPAQRIMAIVSPSALAPVRERAYEARLANLDVTGPSSALVQEAAAVVLAGPRRLPVHEPAARVARRDGVPVIEGVGLPADALDSVLRGAPATVPVPQRATGARVARTAFVGGLHSRMLVGIGSGLGNTLHCTPLLRNLARRLGHAVDVVVAGDHDDLLFIPQRAGIVETVYGISDAVLRRRYETVFLTHSFGTMIPRFAAGRVLSSRDWDTFHGGHALHEAEFNLSAAQSLLGIDYEPDDIVAYYVGDVDYEPPDTVLIGLHAGSKGGVWGQKRWPGFAELARRLQADGCDVASFGMPNEYVPGTIDMTGDPLPDMVAAMTRCSHLVANDSGVMNVANALGIPLVALFGPTSAHSRGPLSETSHTLAIRRDCAPCERRAPYRVERFLDGACPCIAELSVDQVHGAVVAMIEGARAEPQPAGVG